MTVLSPAEAREALGRYQVPNRVVNDVVESIAAARDALDHAAEMERNVANARIDAAAARADLRDATVARQASDTVAAEATRAAEGLALDLEECRRCERDARAELSDLTATAERLEYERATLQSRLDARGEADTTTFREHAAAIADLEEKMVAKERLAEQTIGGLTGWCSEARDVIRGLLSESARVRDDGRIRAEALLRR